MRIVLRVLLSPGCINLKNLCAHLQEEVLTIPKHPLLAQFDESEAKLWCSKEDRVFLKYFWYSILGATLFFAVFSANTHQKDDFWGVFRKPEDLLLIMGTEILKIDAEMAEKIEVEVGNPHLKTDRKAEKGFLW